jgi:hypothetical protein
MEERTLDPSVKTSEMEGQPQGHVYVCRFECFARLACGRMCRKR